MKVTEKMREAGKKAGKAAKGHHFVVKGVSHETKTKRSKAAKKGHTKRSTKK